MNWNNGDEVSEYMHLHSLTFFDVETNNESEAMQKPSTKSFTRKYLVFGGYVTSRNDGQEHYIHAVKVIELFRIPRIDCFTIDTEEDKRSKLTLLENDKRFHDMIRLFPDSTGEYNMQQVMEVVERRNWSDDAKTIRLELAINEDDDTLRLALVDKLIDDECELSAQFFRERYRCMMEPVNMLNVFIPESRILRPIPYNP